MYSTVRTAVLDGISAIPVQVEVVLLTPKADMILPLYGKRRIERNIYNFQNTCRSFH